MTPPLAELIAWSHAQVAETTRRNFRDLDTRRIDAKEAQRRLALAKGVVTALEAFARNAPAQVAASFCGPSVAPSATGQGSSPAPEPGPMPPLEVHLRCGQAWHQDAFMNAPMLIAGNRAAMAAIVEVVATRMVDVVRRSAGGRGQ